MAHAPAPFFAPPPLGPLGGAKRSNIIKSELQSHFQRFETKLTNERHIAYQTGFSFGRLGHILRGWTRGYRGGWGHFL